MTLVAGVLYLRNPPQQASNAVRVDSATGLAPAPTDSVAPQSSPVPQASPVEVETVEPPAPAGAAISLTELAQELQARSATSTTRPPTTVATAAPPTTSPPVTATTTPAPAPPAPASSTTTTPPAPPAAPLEAITPPPAADSPAAAAAGAGAAADADAGPMTNSATGIASWFGAPEATCAHLTLPFGTLIKVTRIETGASATCKVDDRGPTLETGRLIDLSRDTFEKLAPASVGLIDVRIEW